MIMFHWSMPIAGVLPCRYAKRLHPGILIICRTSKRGNVFGQKCVAIEPKYSRNPLGYGAPLFA